jgi:hypothetical protein
VVKGNQRPSTIFNTDPQSKGCAKKLPFGWVQRSPPSSGKVQFKRQVLRFCSAICFRDHFSFLSRCRLNEMLRGAHMQLTRTRNITF